MVFTTRDVTLMDSQRPDDTHPLGRERIHLLLLEDARRGMEDIAAGRTEDADAALARLQKSRAADAGSSAFAALGVMNNEWPV